jgi:two-component system, response regulator
MREDDALEGVILLVDDNPDDVDLTLRALQQHNIRNPVVVARDGVEALDYLLGRGQCAGPERPPLPVVVLLDIKLPKLDGIEVLRQIREEERTTLLPVVILTSSKEERDIVNGYRLRANSYICKPVDFVQFAEAIRQLHLYWVVLNLAPPVK